MADEKNPASTSADYDAMFRYWTMVDDLLAGVERLREKGTVYLPQFPEEDAALYELRRKSAPLTNVFTDISRNLASKPFSKPVEISDDAPEVIAGRMDDRAKVRRGGLVDDIDGQGNSLHVFASEAFKAGIDKGIAWILVDHTPARPRADGRPLSRAEEQAQGLRPYWVHIPCQRLLAVYAEFVGGVEVLTHARIDETVRVRNGYGEETRRRVRVIDRQVTERAPDGRALAFGAATWELFEEQQNATSQQKSWVSIATGAYSIGVIPLVPFIPGKRHGTSYVVDPPLRDIAWMQLEAFQQESNLKEVKTLTAFPMLVGEGVEPPARTDEQGRIDPLKGKEKIAVGPRAVLIVPPNGIDKPGTWKFIEPETSSLTFLKDDLAAFRQEMRDLGMQPLMAANLTVITTANVSQKASSAVQAWAILFKDTLDRCLALTSKWLGVADIATAKVHTDFVVGLNSDTDLGELLKARTAGEISRRRYWAELQRRGKLGPDFDPDVEEELLEAEGPAFGTIEPPQRDAVK